MFNVENHMVKTKHPLFFERFYGCQSRPRGQNRKSNGIKENPVVNM